MNKNNFIKYGIPAVVIILVIAAAAIYFSFKKAQELAEEETIEEELPLPQKAEDPSVAGTLPSIGSGDDVVVPEINPVDRANPFQDVYQNPFE